MEIKSLAKIGKGTRRKYRDLDLLDVSEEIKSLYLSLRSLSKVAELTKLSPEMVREFLQVNKLDPRVKHLIKKRFINSVDIAYRLSKLKKDEQYILAKLLIKNDFTSKDIRNIVNFKIDNPQISLIRATERVIQSKDKKLFVGYFGIEKDVFDSLSRLPNKKRSNEDIIKSFFLEIVTEPFLVDFELNGRVAIIRVTREGLSKLRIRARLLRIPLKQIANRLVVQYCRGHNL